MTRQEEAQELVGKIDDEFGLDIVMYQTSDLKRLVSKIQEFLKLGIDTDDLTPAGDMGYEEIV